MPGTVRKGEWKALSFPFSFILIGFCAACSEPKVESPPKKADYIREITAESDSIPVKVAQAGEVLVGYSDCHTCHKIDKRSAGPAFKDIAKRYPVQDGYITMLAQKVIIGGSGAWGTAVMSAHPELSVEDAKAMVTYILSLKEMK